MSENWDALVSYDDEKIKSGFKAVMPLPWNKKFGTAYLRQPAFTQQLGIFGKDKIDNKTTALFLQKAMETFPFAEINLNYANEFSDATQMKYNLVLDLNKPFSEIEKSFRNDFVNILKKKTLVYKSAEDTVEVIQLFKKHYSERISVPPGSFENWEIVCTVLKSKNQLLIRRVEDEKGDLLSTAIFFKDERRIYYVMSVTLSQGRKNQSNYYLLYQVIKEFANQQLLFDFEGSDIYSIRQFFVKFAATNQPYPFVKYNQLPVTKKWMKNIIDRYRNRP